MKCDAYTPLHTAPSISPSATPLWRAYQNFAGNIYSFSHPSIQKSEAKASNCVWNFWKLRIKNGAMVEFGFFCAWRTSLCQACRKKYSDKERKKNYPCPFLWCPFESSSFQRSSITMNDKKSLPILAKALWTQPNCYWAMCGSIVYN